MSNNITTGKFRASFVNVFKPRASQSGGDPRYSITMLIPKTDVATINAINNEIEIAVQENIPTLFGGVRPAKVNIPIYDGDGVRPSGEPFGEECRGCMVMTANANADYPPEVVDINGQAIINHSEFYSGCYARASIRFFAYNKNGNKGVGCGLNCVQKLGDGEPLTGGISAAAAFANPYVEAGQAQQPIQYQQPIQPQQYAQQLTQQYQQPTQPQQYAQTTQYQQPIQPQQYVQQPTQQYQQTMQTSINPITGLPMNSNAGIMGLQ